MYQTSQLHNVADPSSRESHPPPPPPCHRRPDAGHRCRGTTGSWDISMCPNISINLDLCRLDIMCSASTLRLVCSLYIQPCGYVIVEFVYSTVVAAVNMETGDVCGSMVVSVEVTLGKRMCSCDKNSSTLFKHPCDHVAMAFIKNDLSILVICPALLYFIYNWKPSKPSCLKPSNFLLRPPCFFFLFFCSNRQMVKVFFNHFVKCQSA